MALSHLTWANLGARDVHLVPGLVSPNLAALLRGVTEAGATVGVTDPVQFFAAFAGAPSAHGATLNPANGVVTAGAATDARPLRSFLLTAMLNEGGNILTTRIRVHLHGAVAQLWLTPNPLTVRVDSTRLRMSVLARFDDGVIGDITNWSGFDTDNAANQTYVHEQASTRPALQWSAGDGPVSVHRDTGILTATEHINVDTDITVVVRGNSASGTARCAGPWGTPVMVERVPAASGAEARAVPNVATTPNVLFLPDGFQQHEKPAFDAIVASIVDKLHRNGHTRPFKDLRGRINYWSAFVPSREPGVSVLTELVPRTQPDGSIRGHTMPLPSRNPPNSPWSEADLLNRIGLPNPHDDPPGSTLASKLDALRTLYGTTITEPLVAPQYGKWIGLTQRVLLDERDSAFHMAFGGRPAVGDQTPDRFVGVNTLRMASEDLAKFLDALVGPPGTALPPKTWTTGKDRNLVVIICRSGHRGGLNRPRRPLPGRTIGVSLAAQDYHPLPAAAVPDGGLLPQVHGLAEKPGYYPWVTTAHELGHSWDLGDEYAEADEVAPARASELADADTRPNLVTFDKVANDKADPTKGINAWTVKWATWPRVTGAAVLVDTTVIAGDNHSATLKLGREHAAAFGVDEFVQLRTRPLGSAQRMSFPYRITHKTADGLVVAPLGTDQVDADLATAFPAGSVCLRTLRFAGSAPTDFQRLVNEAVLARIAVTGNPLNAGPNEAPNRPTPNIKFPVPTAATNFPDGHAPPPVRYSAYTIGLYENGGTHRRGIYRPTGTCLMTRSLFGDEDQKVQAYQFCLVCRYALIDAIDPSLHPAIDLQWQARYLEGTE